VNLQKKPQSLPSFRMPILAASNTTITHVEAQNFVPLPNATIYFESVPKNPIANQKIFTQAPNFTQFRKLYRLIQIDRIMTGPTQLVPRHATP
jgi:hypothetical protein